MCSDRTSRSRFVGRLGMAVLTGVVLVLTPAAAMAVTNRNYTNGGLTWNFNDALNWDTGVPVAGETATFNIPGTYPVYFPIEPTNLDLFVKQGAVTFSGQGFVGTPTYTITQAFTGGTANLTGGSLTLGTAGHPIGVLFTNNRDWVQTGGTTYVTNASVFYPGSIHLGVSVANSTSLVIDGSVSNLHTLSISSTNYLGRDGATGSLTLQNNSTGSLNSDTYLAYSGANSVGNITVQSNAILSTTSLWVGTQGGVGQVGTITVTGAGSGVTQMGSSTLTVGAASNSTGTLSVLSNGTFTTGTGLTKANPTGLINVNGGTFNAHGDINVIGGTFQTLGSGALNWDPSRWMTIVNGGTVSLAGGYTLPASATVYVLDPSSKLQTAAALVVNGGSQLNVMAGGSVAAGGYLDVADSGSGTLLVDGVGSSLSAGAGVCSWGGGGGTGTVTFRNGASGTITAPVTVADGLANSGTLNVQSGATLSLGALQIAAAVGTEVGTVTVTDATSAITQTAGTNLTVGATSGSTANLNVNSLGTYTVSAAGNTYLNPTGTITINGGYANLGTLHAQGGLINLTAGSLSFVGDLKVGVGGPLGANLTLDSTKSLTLSGTTTIDPFHTLTLSGGTLSTGDLTNNGSFSFTSGTLGITGVSGLYFGSELGAVFTLNGGCNLNVTNATTVPGGAAFTIAGGQMTSGALAVSSNGSMLLQSGSASASGTLGNSGSLTIQGGSLSVGGAASNYGSLMFQGGNLSVSGTLTNQAGGQLSVGPLGYLLTPGPITNLGSIALLGGSARLGGAGTLSNNGLILGDGLIDKPSTNTSAGEIRGESGKHLTFSGTNGPNAGMLNLMGGTLEFSQPLTNTNGASATIMGHGTLIVHGGAGALDNQGVMAFTTGQTDVFAKVTNESTGQIVISGGGSTTFYDDVNAIGGSTLKVSGPGSTLVFFGSYNGGTTGTGTVYNEGDLRPGHSPAQVSFGGQLINDSRVWIELGGTTRGSQYDAIDVANNVNLGGTLNVTTINGFRPAHNDQFTVLTFASRTGDFASKTGMDLGSRLTLVPQYTPTSLLLTAVQGGSGSWRYDQSGNSSISTNWTAAIPNGTGDVATLGPIITTAQTVTVDQPTTLGGITLSNLHRYTLAGPGTITLDNGASAATIQVDAAGPDGHIIGAPLNIASDLTLQVNAGSLTLAGPISDPLGKKITKLGAGTAIFSGAQTYAVGTVLQFGSGGGGSPEYVAGSSPNAVPEPATLVMLAAGALCLLAHAWRRRKRVCHA